MVKSTKHMFFDQKIQEISNKTRCFQELMNQVKKKNLPAVKAIKYNTYPCLKINDLWNALHSTFNLAQNHHIDINILDETLNKLSKEWPLFSKEEFRKAIAKCNNLSAPGCCGNYQTQSPIITQGSKALSKLSIQGLQKNSTRSLYWIATLFI